MVNSCLGFQPAGRAANSVNGGFFDGAGWGGWGVGGGEGGPRPRRCGVRRLSGARRHPGWTVALKGLFSALNAVEGGLSSPRRYRFRGGLNVMSVTSVALRFRSVVPTARTFGVIRKAPVRFHDKKLGVTLRPFERCTGWCNHQRGGQPPMVVWGTEPLGGLLHHPSRTNSTMPSGGHSECSQAA